MLVATMPSWITMEINQDELNLGGGTGPSPWKTTKDLVRAFDETAEQCRKALAGTNDDHLMTEWRLVAGGRTVGRNPRHVFIADTFTHMAHHRAQLGLYLRLNNVPVPSMYGPTADEPSF